MPQFTFKARTRQGEVRSGEREALDQATLVAQLRDEGMVVLAVERVSTTGEAQRGLPPPWHPSWLLPIASIDIEMGLRQIASMLRSGVSVLTAIETTAQHAMRPRVKQLWLELEWGIRSGVSLSDAMQSAKKGFGQYIVQLAKVGERSGEMDVALARAAEYLELHRNVRVMAVNALIYPCIATLMAVGVSLYLVMAVIPKIATFLEAGGGKLPAITQMLIDLSQWLHLNGLIVLALVVGVVAALFFMRRHVGGRELQDQLLLRLPLAGRILRISATAVFARGLGMLLESGVTLLDALDALGALLGNQRYVRRINEAREGIMRGASLSGMLAQAPEFLPHLANMTAVAETSGTLGPTLAEVAHFHENLLVIAIKRFSVLIEPFMIVVTGGLVGFVYIAFFMALFSMISTV